jgi:hypothetical protein
MNKHSNLASTQAGYTKSVPFCIPSYIFPTINLSLPFLWKRGTTMMLKDRLQEVKETLLLPRKLPFASERLLHPQAMQIGYKTHFPP